MLSCFKWYRRIRGGYWVYWHFIDWQRVDKQTYLRAVKERCGQIDWSLEEYKLRKLIFN